MPHPVDPYKRPSLASALEKLDLRFEELLDAVKVRLETGARLRFIAFLTIAASLAALLSISWRKWPDIVVDYGRELYLPWRIIEGQVLYRDVQHIFGPFSQYLNALILSLWGSVSYTALFTTDLIIFLVFLGLIYKLISELTTPFTGWFCTLMTVLVFAVPHLTINGNYNYLAPYAHEATHGIVMAFALLYCLWRYSRGHSGGWLSAGGLLLGFIILAKVEISVAAAAALMFFFGLRVFTRVTSPRAAVSELFKIALFAALPIFAAFAYFSHAMGASQALHELMQPWVLIFNKKVTGLLFYRWIMGLTNVPGNLYLIPVSILIWYAPLALFYWLSVRLRRISVPVVVLLVSGLAMAVSIKGIDGTIARPLPLLLLLTLGYLILRLRKSTEGEARAKLIALATFCVFSLMLLFKMLLAVRISFYGFFLALPAFLTLIVVLIHFMERDFQARTGKSAFYTLTVVCVFFSVAAAVLNLSARLYNWKDYAVGVGLDKFYYFTSPGEHSISGMKFNAALAWLEVNTEKSDTLVVIPEGVMINYLSKRINPTRYYSFMPPEVLGFGEVAIVDNLNLTRPRFIMLASRDMREYGFKGFGQSTEYGRGIVEWIGENYERVARIESPLGSETERNLAIYELKNSQPR